jgi:DNA polymerase-3 subunit gamma/tau
MAAGPVAAGAAPGHAGTGVPERSASQAGAPATAAATTPLALEPANWPAIIEALGLAGPARQLAANCALAGRQGAVVRLLADPRATRTPGSEAKLAEALSRYVGGPVKLSFESALSEAPATPARELQRQDDERLARTRAALESDPNIQALQRRMGATIFPDSVRPNLTEEN